MSPKETKMNKTILRVFLAAAVVLLFCGAAMGAAAATDLIKYNGQTFSADTIIGGQGSPFTTENASYSGTTLTLKKNVSLTAGTLEIIAPKSDTPFTINLADKNLTGNNSASVITVAKDAELVVTGTTGKITGGRAEFGGGVNNSGTCTMNGGSITGNSAKIDGRSAFGGGVNNSGTFTMNGGSIAGNSATQNGGGVHNSGTFIMSGGSIAGNSACNGGGVDNTGTFTMSGSASITGNSANTDSTASVIKKSGGGVLNSGTFTMNSGSITGNTATWNGGGIYNYIGKFTMNGGTIGGSAAGDKNTANGGGGVYVNEGTFTMEGGEITGNTANIDGGGVYVSGPGNFAKGTFAMSGPARITGNSANTNGGGVYVANGNFTMSGSAIITGNSATNGSDVYVFNHGAFTMSGGSIFGYSTTQNGNGVSNSGTFKMEGGEISGYSTTQNGGGVNTSGSFEMSGGIITNNKTTQNGGGVYVANGRFTMSGSAKITRNSANASGGGVYVAGNGNGTMSGGDIFDNSAAGNGGGVLILGTYYMSGGNIFDNRAAGNGGGAYLWNGTFTMNGSAGITKNSATQNGGGVYVGGYGMFEMANKEIKGNRTKQNGGGVYVAENGIVTLSGGSISENTAAGNGGGVYVTESGRFNVRDVPIISGNTKNSTKNNVYLPSKKTISVTNTLRDPAEIGVTTADPPTPRAAVDIARKNNKDYSSYFKSDNDTYRIANAGTDDSQNVVLGIPHTVTFDENGHGTAPDPQIVLGGKRATRPADPTAYGYTFGGWFKEADCINEWFFKNNPVIEDMTLYAKWMVDELEVLPVEDTEHPGTKKAETDYDIPPVTPDSDYVPAKLDSVSEIPDNSEVVKVKCEATTDVPKAGEDGIVMALTAVKITLLNQAQQLVTSLSSEAVIKITIPKNNLPGGVNESNARIAHCVDGEWVILPGAAKFEGANLVVTGYSSTFSPFAVVQIQQRSSSSGSTSQGSSIWLTAEPTPTVTPTPAPMVTPTPEVPQVKPVASKTPAGKSPAPVMGVIAGLGAAGVLMVMRQRR